MAATYQLLVEGVARTLDWGWSISATANGRDTFTGSIFSADASYRPAMDDDIIVLENVTIVSSSVANPTVITTLEAHGFVTGQTVTVASHVGSTPAISGTYLVTRTGATTFTIPVNVTVGGTGGLAQRRIFAGLIDTPHEAGLGGRAVVPIRTTIDCLDYNAMADRRYLNQVLSAGTLTAMLSEIVTAIGDGLTLHPSQVIGPTLAALPCDYALLRDVLDQISVLTGYVWEIDEFIQLRMFLPGSEACPFNAIDGDGNAVGDIVVEPTRDNYANKVILRWSAEARSAYGFLVTTGNPEDAATIVLGSKTYTIQAVLTNVDGNVKRGSSASDTLDNLVAAITRGSGAGTAYAEATVVNPTATAYRMSATTMKAIAITPGAAGNSTTATEDCTVASWQGEGSVPISALALGSDQTLTNVTVAQDAAEIAAHGTWEVVVESPETISQTAASTLAAAYLSVHLPVPKTVRYDTYALGAKPGQTQTITVANRNVNNTFTLLDVVTRNQDDVYTLRHVTALESLLVQAGNRWRETYKQWSSGSGTGGALTVSGPGTIINITGAIYGLGGSQIEWVQSPTPDWVSANSVQVRIDTIARGSTTGTCYARLKSRSGSVTARMRNVSDGTTVGTSAAITNPSYEWTSFAVTLTAGSKLYEIQVLPSLANVDCNVGAAYFE